MATRYVAPTGNDSNPGSSASPYLTWDKGYQASAPGDTVIIKAGTYGSQSIKSRTLTGPSYVTLQADDTGLVNVNGGLTLTGCKFVQLLAAPGGIKSKSLSCAFAGTTSSPVYTTDCVVDGVTVDGGAVAGAGPGYVAGARRITWRHVDIGRIHEANAIIMMDGGFPSVGGVQDMLMEDCVVHDTYLSASSSVHPQGIFVGGVHGLTIRRSRFYGCTAFDIFVTDAGGSLPQNVLMENNVFDRTMLNGDPYAGGKPSCCHARDVAFRDGMPLDGVVFRYNTVRGPVTWPVEGVGAGGAQVYGNIFGGTTGTRPGMQFHHNINGVSNAGAMWVDPDACSRGVAGQAISPGDFHLKAGAPAIGAGDPANFPSTDFDGRPRSGTPSAGAYEFVTAGAVPARITLKKDGVEQAHIDAVLQ